MDAGENIAQVARRTGLRVSAIRYYESIGLVPRARRIHGQRVYDSDVYEDIALVQLAQSAGLTLAEVRGLLAAFRNDEPARARWGRVAQTKIAELDERIACAQKMKSVLEGLTRCGCSTLHQCVRQKAARLRSGKRPTPSPARART